MVKPSDASSVDLPVNAQGQELCLSVVVVLHVNARSSTGQAPAGPPFAP